MHNEALIILKLEHYIKLYKIQLYKKLEQFKLIIKFKNIYIHKILNIIIFFSLSNHLYPLIFPFEFSLNPARQEIVPLECKQLNLIDSTFNSNEIDEFLFFLY